MQEFSYFLPHFRCVGELVREKFNRSWWASYCFNAGFRIRLSFHPRIRYGILKGGKFDDLPRSGGKLLEREKGGGKGGGRGRRWRRMDFQLNPSTFLFSISLIICSTFLPLLKGSCECHMIKKMVKNYQFPSCKGPLS